MLSMIGPVAKAVKRAIYDGFDSTTVETAYDMAWNAGLPDRACHEIAKAAADHEFRDSYITSPRH